MIVFFESVPVPISSCYSNKSQVTAVINKNPINYVSFQYCGGKLQLGAVLPAVCINRQVNSSKSASMNKTNKQKKPTVAIFVLRLKRESPVVTTATRCQIEAAGDGVKGQN